MAKDYKDTFKPMSRFQIERWKKSIHKHGVRIFYNPNLDMYMGKDKQNRFYPLLTTKEEAMNFNGLPNKYITIVNGNSYLYLPYMDFVREVA